MTRGRFYSLLVLGVGYSYDIHNNLTGLTQTVNGVERISSYTYNAWGNPISTTGTPLTNAIVSILNQALSCR